MTRFKELRRIERAISNGDIVDLHWALLYCRSRLKIAPNKSTAKYWSDVSAKVQEALDLTGG